MLFLRDSRHVELTQAGEVLLEESRRLLSDAERVVGLTRAAAYGAGRRKLVVGFQANAAAELTPQILSAFQSQFPSVQVHMQGFDFTDPYVGLADGSADVAFVRPPLVVKDWLGLETLFVEPRVLVVSTSSPLAAQSEVSVEQVTNEFFVARKAPEDWRNFWLATDSRQGEPVRLGAEVSTVDECFEAILSQRGVAFSQASTQRYLQQTGTRIRSRHRHSRRRRCRSRGAPTSTPSWSVISSTPRASSPRSAPCPRRWPPRRRPW